MQTDIANNEVVFVYLFSQKSSRLGYAGTESFIRKKKSKVHPCTSNVPITTGETNKQASKQAKSTRAYEIAQRRK